MTFTADIRDRKVVWCDPEAARRHVASLDGKRVNISIDVRRPRRSDEQNRFYWGVCIPAILRGHSDFEGWDPEDVHEWLKATFLSREFNGTRFAQSTATLNTQGMAMYLDRVIRYAAEHGVVIEDPKWR